MNVLLVQTPTRNIRFNIGSQFNVLPLGLAYIARQLIDAKIPVSIFSTRNIKHFPKDLRSFLASQKDPIIIGLGATLFSAREAFALACIAKSINPKNVVVLGGAITVFSERSLFKYSPHIDYVITGDAEKAFVSLAQALRKKASVENISNVAYRKNNSICVNDQDPISDLDALGIPDRSVFPRYLSRLHPPMGVYSPAFLVETIRGCSYRCTFCSLPHNMRMRSVDMVVTELLQLQHDFNAQEVHFVDPTFTIMRSRTQQLCEAIIKNKISIHWSCKTRVDCVDAELLQIMKAAGCYMIHFGVESASAPILHTLKKDIKVESSVAAFKHCHDLGLRTGAFMIFAATEHDGDATVLESMSLIKKLNPTYVLYDYIKPIPGRVLTKDVLHRQVMTENDLEEYYLGDKQKSRLSDTTITGYPIQKAEGWVSRASCSFYLSPRTLFRLMCGIKTWDEGLNVFRAGGVYIKELFQRSAW